MSASPQYDRRRLFVASCAALVTTAMTFSIRGDILDAFGKEFNLSHQQQGYINLIGAWGFPVAMLLGGPLCDVIGLGRLLRFACLGHLASVMLTIISPRFGFAVLLAATLVLGISNGLVEAVINPLCATMFPDQKTHKLNVLHAWWPGGMIIGGLLATGISRTFALGPTSAPATLSLSWKVKMATVLVTAVLYGLLLIGQRFPSTERVAHGVSNAEMWREALRPGFILMLGCMLLTAATELGPDQWIGSVLRDTVGMQDAILFLVYTSGLMFVLRFFAGPIAHRISPFGLLLFSAVLSAIGLFALSHAFTAWTALAAATVFGIGKTYFWPTMLGVTSERYPRGGSLLMAMMGGAGSISAGLAGPVMGNIYDTHTIKHLPPRVAQVVVVNEKFELKAVDKLTDASDKAAVKEALKQGAAMTFRYVAVLPCILVFVFGAMFVYFKSRGGYRAVRMSVPVQIE